MDTQKQQAHKTEIIRVGASIDKHGNTRRAHTRMQKLIDRAKVSGTIVSKRFDSALAMASEAHAGQVRKGTSIPYISHPVAVASLVSQYGGDEDQAIAGLLHDVLEDGGPQWVHPIREQFGPRVLSMVESCTDGVPDATGKKPPWKQRKVAYLEHLAHASDDALLVSACDKLHNLRSIVLDLGDVGESVFDRFTAGKDGTIWYYRQLVSVLAPRVPAPLGHALASLLPRLT